MRSPRVLSLALAALALMAAAFTMTPAPARAAGMCCVGYYDYDDAKSNTNNIISTLSDKINAMQLAIVEALRLGVGQLSGNSKEQIGAHSNMANVNDDRRVTGNVEMARFNSIKSAAAGASSCNTTTAGIGTGGIGKNVISLSKSMTSDLVNWDVGGDQSVPSYQGSDVAVSALVNRHCSLYANAADVKSGLCQSAASGDMMNADIDISKSLFGGTAGADTLTLSTQTSDAAQTFIINALDPKPSGVMNAQEAKTEGGRQRAAARNALAAKVSTAKYALADILSRRMPQKDSQTLTQWAQSTSSQIAGYQGSFPNGVSWQDAMDIKARSWYQNPNWGTAVASQGAEQATKDSAAILAFLVYEQWEMYKLIEKQNAMMASMVALLGEQAKNTIAAPR